MYNVIISPSAQKDILRLRKKAPNAYKKFMKIYDELEQHPKSGTGQCEQLKHHGENTWSRRLDKEHRIVYRVYDDIVEVYVLSAYGHYE